MPANHLLPNHLKDAIHHYLPTMEGWTVPERGCEMAELIIESKPEVVVEIGVFAARSLISQAMALRENGRGKIYGIDPWKKDAAFEGENDANKEWWDKVDLEQMHRLTMESIWNHRLDQWAIVLRASSQDCAQLFPEIHVISIDGNHSEVASCRDVQLYLPRVVRGGYVWFDDADWDSTKTAQRLIEQQCDVVKASPDGHYKLYRKR